MKNVCFLLLLLSGSVFLSNCSKNNDEEKPGQEYLYIINLQANNILSYQKYNGAGDTLLEEASYRYMENKTEKTIFLDDTILRHTIYLIADYRVIECYDTVFQANTANEFYHHFYTHSEGKLVKDEFENKFPIDDSIYRVNWIYEYAYDADGNMTSLSKTVVEGDETVSCTDGFTYATALNFFDVNNFEAKITGALSTNLAKQRTYDLGCPGGPGWTYSSSTYNYVIIEGGLVVKMTENYSSGYRFTSNTYQYTFN